MRLEWDRDKRIRTLKERGLDFADGYKFFDGRAALHQKSPRHDEDRWKSTAIMDDGKLYTVVWIEVDLDLIRIISLRRSHDKEERHYRELHG